MKKEYLILIVLILGLGGYLLFYQEDTDHTDLPRLPDISADKITAIHIAQQDMSITLEKKEKTWQIEEIDRPAETLAVNNMTDALKNLKLSALVSTKQDLQRYELDDAHKIEVTVFEAGKKVLELAMGKTAPTYNHTFVMVDGDRNVYHASGSFRTYFDKDIPALRDKTVLEFKEESVKEFTVTKQGISQTFVAGEVKKEGKEPLTTWSGKDGNSADKETVSNLLSTLAVLECESFMDDDKKRSLEKHAALCRLSIVTDRSDPLTVALYRQDGGDALSGVSSMNPDAFGLNKSDSENLMTAVDKLLGIETKEKAAPENG